MVSVLKMAIVVERVETIEDFAVLQALGCDQAQEFFVTRLVEADHTMTSLQ